VLLRIIHIVCGATWVGAVILLAAFVEPIAARAGSAGSQYLQRLGGSKVGLFISSVAILTILGGFALYWILGYSLNTTAGATFLIGGLIGLAALVVGGALTGPSTAKLGRLGAEIQAGGNPPTSDQAAQIAALQARMKVTTRVTAVLVVVSVTLMAIARYL
jgi:uncharacterized membrane protein